MKTVHRELIALAEQHGMRAEQRTKHIAIIHPKLGIVALIAVRKNEKGRGNKNTRAQILRAARGIKS